MCGLKYNLLLIADANLQRIQIRGGGNLNIFLLLMLLFYVNEALAWRYSAKMRAALSTLAAQGRDL